MSVPNRIQIPLQQCHEAEAQTLRLPHISCLKWARLNHTLEQVSPVLAMKPSVKRPPGFNSLVTWWRTVSIRPTATCYKCLDGCYKHIFSTAVSPQSGRIASDICNTLKVVPLSSRVRMVADRHRLDAYHNKHCWQVFQGYQQRWHWTTLNPKNMGFKSIFRYFRLWREWICAEIYWR